MEERDGDIERDHLMLDETEQEGANYKSTGVGTVQGRTAIVQEIIVLLGSGDQRAQRSAYVKTVRSHGGARRTTSEYPTHILQDGIVTAGYTPASVQQTNPPDKHRETAARVKRCLLLAEREEEDKEGDERQLQLALVASQGTDAPEQVTKKLGRGWAWFATPTHGRSGRHPGSRNKEIGWVDVETVSRYAVHLTITLMSGQTWIWTMVYASTHIEAQQELWEELMHMATINTPWAIIGDFNAFLSPQEKRCSGEVTMGPKCKAFAKFVDDVGLCDLGYEGIPYTWCNNQKGDRRMWIRLDRALGNTEWVSEHPVCKVQHLDRGASDHAPILLSVPLATTKEPAEVSQISTSIYQSLWGDVEDQGDGSNEWPTLPSISAEEAIALERPVTPEEIKEAVWSLPRGKAPGPDGMLVEVYIKYWDTISGSLCQAVGHFFTCAAMPRSWGETFITLIPKKEHPTRVADYRPIALCNVMYKVIAKVMVSRLKLVLPNLIGPEQAAFVADRCIGDNTLATQEVAHSMAVDKGEKPIMMIKMDMETAYDRVSWQAVVGSLQRMGFPPQWCNWVQACIASPRFALLINGSPTNWITPHSGLRQGDPLSPYLFIIVTQVLTRIINEKVDQGLMRDDLLLMTEASTDSAQSILECLNRYEKITNQRVNYSKSELYLPTRIGAEEGKQLSVKLRLKVTAMPFKYLGVLISGRRVKVKEHQVTTAKQQGGLGVRRLRDARTAHLGKLVFKMLNREQAPWIRIMQAKYGSLHPWEPKKIQNASWVWRALTQIAKQLRMGCRVLIGNGRSTRAAYDLWVQEVPWSRQPRELASALMDENLRVVDITNNLCWTTARLCREAGSDMAYEISTFPMGTATSEDRWIWWPHPRGTPSVKAIYHSLQSQSEHQWEGWRILWRLPVAPRIGIFCWKLLWGRLPTRAYLQYIHIGSEEGCAMCGQFRETVDHLMFTCRYNREVWEILQTREGVEIARIDQEWIMREWSSNKEEDRQIKGMLACTLWSLWKSRNEVVFGEKKTSEIVVVRRAVALAEEYRHKNKEKKQKEVSSRKRWEPPQPGWIKVNTDGALRAGACQGGATAVFHDATGELVQAVWEPCPGSSALQTELWAIRLGLKAAERDCRLEIETDCLEAIRCMQRIEHCPWRVRNLVQECVELANECLDVRFTHVGREANKVADWAAAKASVASGSSSFERLSHAPPKLCKLIAVDTDYVSTAN
ncbi:uncharacterized protein [Typha latifolia]|uniref:uncharacterized protein n=1 Tax=Typha latifolia TaxID=4733 RepID=UPI003C30CEDB